MPQSDVRETFNMGGAEGSDSGSNSEAWGRGWLGIRDDSVPPSGTRRVRGPGTTQRRKEEHPEREEKEDKIEEQKAAGTPTGTAGTHTTAAPKEVDVDRYLIRVVYGG